MKRNILLFSIIFSTLICFAVGSESDVMIKTDDGVYIVNTTALCDVRGFRGATPVEVYIKKDKVIKVIALKNEESPGYFVKVKNFLLPIFENLKLSTAKKAASQKSVDGCTGATYSTKAVQNNIAVALDYYETHK